MEMNVMDEKFLGRNVKVFTEKIEYSDDTVGRWFRGKLMGSTRIGEREFMIVRWEKDDPKERLIPLDRVTLIEMDENSS
jgi:hypothetical protein